MDSIVCGMTPSSADTTRTMMSVTMAPLSRRAVKAAWPGVSRKVMSSPDDVFTAKKKHAIYTGAIPSLKDFLQKSVVGV